MGGGANTLHQFGIAAPEVSSIPAYRLIESSTHDLSKNMNILNSDPLDGGLHNAF